MPDYKILPQAEHDLDNCVEYIARDNLDAALRLYDCSEKTYQLLAKNPNIGGRYPSQNPLLSDVRFFPISDFKKYLAFYRPSDKGIEVIRVLRTSRNIEKILL